MGATQIDKLWLENPSLSLKVNLTAFCYDVAINVNRPMVFNFEDQLWVQWSIISTWSSPKCAWQAKIEAMCLGNFFPDSHGFGTCVTKLELLDSLQEMELNTNFVSHYIYKLDEA